ncbi:hypothetical protein BDF22DRAFT_654693 [Syncephalis plumigaleata]|nr:hypothetical protein BDF22DRAFT_654693 [Syncephalis plumigaleata]
MEHGSRISNYTSETIDQLRSSRATTIVVSNLSAHTSGCRTVAEVGNAVEKLSQQLVDLGFPPIKLFVFMDTVKLLTPDDSSYRGTCTRLGSEQWLHQSIHAASFFPKLLMLCFRTGVFLNLFLQILSFIIYVLLYSNQIAFVEGSWVSFMYDYSQFITYSINIVTFGTFIIWFAYSMHKLRQHSEARSKFLQRQQSTNELV